jgi:hypothetical protein
MLWTYSAMIEITRILVKRACGAEYRSTLCIHASYHFIRRYWRCALSQILANILCFASVELQSACHGIIQPVGMQSIQGRQ